MSKDKSDAEKKARKEEKKKRKLSESAGDIDLEEPVAKKEKKNKTKRKSTSNEDDDVDQSVIKAELQEDDDEKEQSSKSSTKVPIGALVPFANPLASDEKQQKKILKAVKKAAKAKTLKRGVKETVKAIRKTAPAPGVMRESSVTPPGIVIIAADISPMDVISHIPVLCEDFALPYLFIPSRAELGAAGSTKRPTSVCMVAATKGKNKSDVEEDAEWAETYRDLYKLATKMEKDAPKI